MMSSQERKCGLNKRTFEVGHEGFSAGVESIHDHLSVGWPSDLNPPVLETRGGWGTDPGLFSADICGLGWEIEFTTVVELLLHRLPGFEERLTGGIESPVEGGEELESIVSEDSFLSLWGNVGKDLNSLHSHKNLSEYDE